MGRCKKCQGVSKIGNLSVELEHKILQTFLVSSCPKSFMMFSMFCEVWKILHCGSVQKFQISKKTEKELLISTGFSKIKKEQKWRSNANKMEQQISLRLLFISSTSN